MKLKTKIARYFLCKLNIHEYKTRAIVINGECYKECIYCGEIKYFGKILFDIKRKKCCEMKDMPFAKICCNSNLEADKNESD